MTRGLLITGGAGLLGFHLARRFGEAGIPVRVLDRVPAAAGGGAAGRGVETLVGDVRDVRLMDRALEGIDVVVHGAFVSPRAPVGLIADVNVGGTRTICEAALARRVRRLIVVSSTIVREPARRHPLLAQCPLSRLAAYRDSLVAVEAMAGEYRQGGLSTVVARPKTVFGPEQVRGFGIVFEWIRRGGSVIVLGRGDNRYQLLDVRDFCDGLERLAGSDAGGVFEFGAHEFGTVREDLGALIDHAATGARLRFVPGRLARAAIGLVELAGLVPPSEWHYMSAAGRDSWLDTSRAQHELGWRATRSNRQSLIETYDWYASSMAATGSARATHPLPLSHRALSALARLLPR